MEHNKRNTKRRIIVNIMIFFIFFFVVFLGIQFFTKTGVFRIPGVVYYDESLKEEEISILQSIFTEKIDLDKDVTISAYESKEKPELKEGEFLYSIKVATTYFYDTRDDVSEFPEKDYEIIPIEELSFDKKLLSIDENYYLDTFDKGAYFRIIKFESEKYQEEIESLVAQQFNKVFPNEENVLSFAQTGVTALSRGMNKKLNEIGDATYFASGINQLLSSFDLTHTSNESSFTDFATSNNICSDKRFIDTLISIGLDIVELTGNHNQDCGDEAALETIDTYNQNNIRIVGGGKNSTEASAPLGINQKNNRITFLAFNQSTGGATYDNTPGANQYYEVAAANQINEAKLKGDFVVVDIQYYECSQYASEYEDNTCDYANSSAGDQIGFFRHLIDLGADMVVGTSAHQPQTFELYNNGVIYYGLGNLFFDQIWWPGTTRSIILANYYYNNQLIQTKLIPTVYDASMQTKIMDKETKQWFLGRLIDEKP